MRPEDRGGRRIDRPEQKSRYRGGESAAPTLVALAAGVGSRYGGLKQLEPVGPHGETLLEYSVYDALRAGFSSVLLVVRPETESVFREKFEPGMAKHVDLAYVHQTLTDLPSDFALPAARCRPWGTGQAVLAAAAEIDGAFAVVNADDFYGRQSYSTLYRFLNQARHSDVPTFAMVGFDVGQTLTDAGPVSRALCQLDDEGRLQQIVEIAEMWKLDVGGRYAGFDGQEVAVQGDELVSMNMWGFSQELFPALKEEFRLFLARHGQRDASEFLVPDVIQTLIRQGRIQVEILRQEGVWCGITFPEDKQRVAGFIAMLVDSGEYPEELWA